MSHSTVIFLTTMTALALLAVGFITLSRQRKLQVKSALRTLSAIVGFALAGFTFLMFGYMLFMLLG